MAYFAISFQGVNGIHIPIAENVDENLKLQMEFCSIIYIYIYKYMEKNEGHGLGKLINNNYIRTYIHTGV